MNLFFWGGANTGYFIQIISVTDFKKSVWFVLSTKYTQITKNSVCSLNVYPHPYLVMKLPPEDFVMQRVVD